MKKLIRFLLMFLSLIYMDVLSGSILNVPAQYSSIQAALFAAAAGDTVLVVPGHYYENIQWPPVNGIRLLSAGDTTNTIIDGSHLSHVILFPVNVTYDTTTVVKGFTITNGYDTGTQAGGGGISLKSGSHILLENLHITRNNVVGGNMAFGAGLWCQGAHPVIHAVKVDYNNCQAGYALGGGIAFEYSNHAYLYHSIIEHNNCEGGNYAYGGGVYAELSNDLDLNYLSIRHNSCFGTYAGGGGLYIESSGSCLLDSLGVSDNICKSGSYAMGGGVYIEDCTLPVIREVSILNNRLECTTYQLGGGLYCDMITNGLLNNVQIHSNYTSDSAAYNLGAGMYHGGTSLVLLNVIIDSNRMGSYAFFNEGAGIYCEGVNWDTTYLTLTNVLIASNIFGFISLPQTVEGGAICCDGGVHLELMNVTLAANKSINNSTIQGTGVYCYQSLIHMTNTISWNPNNGPELKNFMNATIATSYSDIRLGWPGFGNISTDPEFVAANDFHLFLNSPCINAGTLSGAPIADLDGNQRPMPAGTNPDMGAYEMDQSDTRVIDPGKTQVGIYPNPFTDHTMIEFTNPDSEKITMCLYNSNGKLVQAISDITTNCIFLERHDLPAGLYLLRLTSSRKTLGTMKIIID